MQKIQIQNTTPVCENFWGNGAIYHCYAEMHDADNRHYSPELADMEADRAGDIKLKIARTFYGWYGYDQAKKEWTWETDDCHALYKWLQRMKDRGIAVALNTGWCIPGDVDGTGFNGQGPLTVPGDWKASVQNYANWVSETVHQLIELRGFDNIKIFTMFTEPGNTETVMPLWKECVDAADAALKRDGRRDKILLMGPNEGSGTTSEHMEWLLSHPTNLDIYSSHCYQLVKDVVLRPGMPRSSDRAIPVIGFPGGRIYQPVKIKPHTNYTLRFTLTFNIPDALHVSGNVICGAFDNSCGTVSSGGQATNRLSLGSTLMVDPAMQKNDFEEYTLNFSSDEANETYIGFFDDIKQKGGEVILCGASLKEEGGNIELLQNPDFTEGLKHWVPYIAGGSTDCYYDWCRWCKTGLGFTPKGKMFIFDEYNAIFDRDNSRMDHGSDIVTAAMAYMNCGCNGSLIWTLFDQQWPNNHTTNNDSFVDGDHRCGTASVLTTTKVPHLSYYAFGLLSRYTGGLGSKVYAGLNGENLHATMNVLPDGNVTVVVVNNKPAADEFILEFEQPLQKKLYRHSFDPAVLVPDETATLPGIDAELQVESTLQDSLAPYSVAVYTTLKD